MPGGTGGHDTFRKNGGNWRDGNPAPSAPGERFRWPTLRILVRMGHHVRQRPLTGGDALVPHNNMLYILLLYLMFSQQASPIVDYISLLPPMACIYRAPKLVEEAGRGWEEEVWQTLMGGGQGGGGRASCLRRKGGAAAVALGIARATGPPGEDKRQGQALLLASTSWGVLRQAPPGQA